MTYEKQSNKITKWHEAVKEKAQAGRKAVNKLIDYATPEMVDWLQLVAQEDPSKALDHVYKFAQFGYPLLSRSQLTGKDDGPIEIESILKDVSRLEKDQGLQSIEENIKIDTDLIFNEEI